jgi:hypothetical protein
MKIKIYKLYLYYTICDLLCNRYVKIIEVFIPDLGYSFNHYEGLFNIIKSDSERYTNKNIFHKIIRADFIKEEEISKDKINMYKQLIKNVKYKKILDDSNKKIT